MYITAGEVVGSAEEFSEPRLGNALVGANLWGQEGLMG